MGRRYPYPACDHVSNITDIWDHQLMQEKWQDILVEVNLLTPPSRIIVSGAHAPIHAHKCLALFSLGRPSKPAPSRLTMWKPNFFSSGTGPTICVDVPTQFQFAAKSIVSTMGIPAVLAIDNPRTSLGNSKEATRACIHIHLEPDKVTAVHMESLLKWMHNALRDLQAIVGTLSTMSSPTAMLLDCMAAAAGHEHGDLSWSSLVISPRLILIETRANTESWNSCLMAAWQRNPTTAGIKIRYRPSLHIKTPFAQVAATASSIAAVRARKGHAPSNPTLRTPQTLRATLSMPLGTCGPLEQWLPAFMQKVASINNIPLQKTAAESGLDVYKWREILAYDGSWTGKVLVQLATSDEVHKLHASLHGQSIEIQHHQAAISVDSDHLDLTSRAATSQTQHS